MLSQSGSPVPSRHSDNLSQQSLHSLTWDAESLAHFAKWALIHSRIADSAKTSRIAGITDEMSFNVFVGNFSVNLSSIAKAYHRSFLQLREAKPLLTKAHLALSRAEGTSPLLQFGDSHYSNYHELIFNAAGCLWEAMLEAAEIGFERRLDDPEGSSLDVELIRHRIDQVTAVGREDRFQIFEDSRLIPRLALEAGEASALLDSTAGGWNGTLPTEDAAHIPSEPESEWWTVTAAAKIAGVEKGTISRAVNASKLKSNGKAGRERLIDAADLTRWTHERLSKPASDDLSDAAVRRGLRRRSGD